MWYTIDIDRIYEWADYKFKEDALHTDLCSKEDYELKPYKYIIIDGEIAINPDWEEIEEEKERERISHLRCTKRVLALILQQFGIPYSQLKSLIDSNEQAQLEWDLCVELERSNPLLDLVGSQLGLTPTDIDNIFKYANGEINSIQKEVV